MSSHSRYRYRGVSRPGNGALGWVAQRKGCCYAARFTSEVRAAQWLARRLGVSVSSLRRMKLPGAEREGKLSYRRVVFHSGCWEARAAGGAVLGYFGTQKEALARVMKETRQTEKQLRRKDFSMATLRARFKGRHRIFRQYVPGDVQAMYDHESKSACMYKEDRSFRFHGMAAHKEVTESQVACDMLYLPSANPCGMLYRPSAKRAVSTFCHNCLALPLVCQNCPATCPQCLVTFPKRLVTCFTLLLPKCAL